MADVAHDRGLSRRLSRTFLLQAAAISIATVLGIYLAGLILKEILITQALIHEAEYYWEHRAANPGFPVPNTANLTGYLAAAGDELHLPNRLRGLPAGFHDPVQAEGFSTVYVSETKGEKLLLVFDGEQVSELAAWFGIVPLTLVLLVLYLSVWIAYRVSQRAVSPITALAGAVNRLDPDSPDPAVFIKAGVDARDDEARILSTALSRFTERLRAFVERERNFTRDASHELRTPLTVIGIATDVLMAKPGVDDSARRDIKRIKRSVRDMEELVETFLLLARESEKGLDSDSVCVNDVIAEELERLGLLVGDKPLKVRQRDDCRLQVTAPPRVLSVMLGNLLRNALAYTDSGDVTVRIDVDGVTITDSGIGMDGEQLARAFDKFFRASDKDDGHGIGLNIVRRLSDRFGWPVSITSTPNVGTRVRVSFPRAQVRELPPNSGSKERI
ncbi:MAG: sensor histidine kinase [Proteobacteria bacterium]|nr:MAG: sensor histidine kinase [Pseudomonadota bacterium]